MKHVRSVILRGHWLPVLLMVLLTIRPLPLHAQESGEVLKLESFLMGRGGAYEVKWSPNGELIAVGAQLEISVYDANFNLIWSMPAQIYRFDSFYWSPSSTRLIVALEASSECHTVIVDLTSQQIEPLFPDCEFINLMWSNTGTDVMSITSDGVIKTWNVDTGEMLRSNQIPISAVSPVFVATLSPDEQYMALRTDTEVSIWDIASERFVYRQPYSPAGAFIGRIVWNRESSLLAIALMDGFDLIDIETGDVVWSMREFSARIDDIDWSSDGRRLVTDDAEGSINLWDVEQRTLISEITSHDPRYYTQFDWHPIQDLLLILTDDSQITLWNTNTVTTLNIYHEYYFYRYVKGWSLDSASFILQTDYRQLVLNTDTGMFQSASYGSEDVNLPFAWQQQALGSSTWSSDGRYLAVSRQDFVEIFERGNTVGASSLYLPEKHNAVYNIAWSADAELLASQTDIGIVVWDVSTGEVSFEMVAELVYPVISWHPQLHRLIVHFRGNPEKIIELETGEQIELANPHNIGFSRFMWHSNGRYVAGITDSDIQDAVFIWNTETGEQVEELDNYIDFAWHPSREWIALAENVFISVSQPPDLQLHVMDVNSGQMLYRLEGQTNSFVSPGSLFWSPDGSKLASVDIRGRVRIWRFDEVASTMP
jgi:WD40 repeat protein